MKIELKNIKHNERLSEETNCFSATVYIDGVKAGEVSNRGTGGCDDFYPHSLEERLNEYAKTLPNMKSEYFPEGLEMNAELLIGEILEKHLLEKQLKGLLKKRVLFLVKSSEEGKFHITQTKALDSANLKRHIDHYVAKGETILNTLPFDEAFTLFNKHAR